MQFFCIIRDFFYNWQTLTTGIIALFIAYITIRQIRQQIALQQKEFDDRRDQEKKQAKRKQTAVRALLPADLSQICGYATSCSDVISEALVARRRSVDIPELEMPVLPPRVLSNLQRMIENVDAEKASVFVALLKCYQVQNARMRSMISDLKYPERFGRNRRLSEENVEQTFEQTVLLYLSATDLLDYGRGRSDDVNLDNFTEADIINAIHNLQIEDVLSDDYRTRLLRILQERHL